jgi:predicted Rossmann-fold nucleotide-binding protein
VLHFPVVMFDTAYWAPLLDWIRRQLLFEGMISPDDLDLLLVTDDTEPVVATILECYEQRCAMFPAEPEKADAQ